MAYVAPQIEVDPDALLALTFDYLRAVMPGWEPSEGQLDVWLGEAFAQIAAQVAEVASDVPSAIFRYFGQNLVGIGPQDAVAASGTATFVAIDTDGPYEVPEGATFAAGLDDLGFQATTSGTIPNGSTSVSLPVQAIEPGEAGNGLNGAAELVDDFDYLVSVTLDAPTVGGQDAETDDDYEARLVEELRLLSPKWITAEDAATLARRVPSVGRSLALDNYVPAGPGGTPAAQTNVEGACAVVVVDETGEPVSGATQAAVLALLQEKRVLNVTVAVMAPSYQNVTVAFTVTVWADFDEAAVVAAAEAAVESYVSPARWGQPDYGDTPRWVQETKVRYLEVAQVLQSVEGVRYVDALTINGGTADVTLTGDVVLPRGTATGAAS